MSRDKITIPGCDRITTIIVLRFIMYFKTGVTGFIIYFARGTVRVSLFPASLGWLLGSGEARHQHKSIKNVSIKDVRR